MKLNAKQQQFMDAAMARYPGATAEQIAYVVCSVSQAERERQQQEQTQAVLADSQRALAAVNERDAQRDLSRQMRAEVEASEARLRELGIAPTTQQPAQPAQPVQRSGTRGRIVKPRTHAEGMALLAARNLWFRAGGQRSGPEHDAVTRIVRSMVTA